MRRACRGLIPEWPPERNEHRPHTSLEGLPRTHRRSLNASDARPSDQRWLAPTRQLKVTWPNRFTSRSQVQAKPLCGVCEIARFCVTEDRAVNPAGVAVARGGGTGEQTDHERLRR